ncbi:unnamed protein product, partial [Mesorhabditis belari]|uniref:Uncharacterized protein n=1 Tax=Mesorhabditis belari TaxID=2138241 RepID=A0AAF3F1U4_9BILA
MARFRQTAEKSLQIRLPKTPKSFEAIEKNANLLKNDLKMEIIMENASRFHLSFDVPKELKAEHFKIIARTRTIKIIGDLPIRKRKLKPSG